MGVRLEQGEPEEQGVASVPESRVVTPAVEVGERIDVYWGRFGRCRCQVHHIGKDGRIWAVRWMRKWQAWTASPEVIEYVQYWRDPKVYVWEKVG